MLSQGQIDKTVRDLARKARNPLNWPVFAVAGVLHALSRPFRKRKK